MVKELNLKNYLKQFKDINVSKLVPLIQYDGTWGLPDKYKIEEYVTNIKAYNKLVEIKRFRLLGRINKNCEKPKTKRLYKGNLRRQGLGFVYENKELWIILKSNWPSSNKNLSLKCLIKNDWIYFVVPKDCIGVWYKYGNGRINFTIIPEKLKLCKEFWENFGILIGEMLRKGDAISISNTSHTVINCTLNYFSTSNLIRLSSWNISIDINSKNIFDKKERYENKIKNYWFSVLNINDLDIKNIRWCKYNSNLNPNFGQINLIYNNKSLKKVISYLIDYVVKNVLKNKQNSIDFLRGLIAAEGSTDKNEVGSLRAVRIASKIEKEREFYYNLLKKIGISSKLYKNNHNIASNGLPNFILCLKYKLFDLNERRNNFFIQRFLNLLTIKSSLLLLNKSLTVSEIVGLLKLSDYRNLNKNFSRLTKLGYLSRVFTFNGFKYSLSNEFKRLLQPFTTANGVNLQSLFPMPTS